MNQEVIYKHIGILYRSKKEQNRAIFSNMDVTKDIRFNEVSKN